MNPRTFVVMTELLPPLLLTGGPAVGKTVVARTLAEITPRTAYLDVDDIRQLVKNGAVAPWHGDEGIAQQLLGVENAAALTRNFTGAGFNVTITDGVNSKTLAIYRRLLPEVLVIRLSLSLEEARRRAGTRRVCLSDEEFETLHREQVDALAVDHQLDVTHLDQAEQLEQVRALWTTRR